jgi:hypothetical protein
MLQFTNPPENPCFLGTAQHSKPRTRLCFREATESLSFVCAAPIAFATVIDTSLHIACVKSPKCPPNCIIAHVRALGAKRTCASTKGDNLASGNFAPAR